jgi:hypothetical protein
MQAKYMIRVFLYAKKRTNAKSVEAAAFVTLKKTSKPISFEDLCIHFLS